MVRLFLVVQMPDARDQGRMTVTPGPFDGFLLRFESRPHMIGMVIDDIVVDRITLPPGLWTCAILSTKCMCQGISCRRGEPTDEQSLPSGFGFVDSGELALYGAEQNESQRGESDGICESF